MHPPDHAPAMRARALAAFVLTLAVTACAVGPEPGAPVPDTGDRFAQASGAAHTDAVNEAEFWRGFDDAQLTLLVDDALAANHDLRIALARLDQASALLRQRRFDQAPTVTAQASAGAERASDARMPGVGHGARDRDSYEGSIDAFWELDFFGRVRRQVQSERAEAQAAAADVAALQVAIVGELAADYFELRGLQARLRVAHENADNQRESLRVVEARLNAGRGTGFDTARAQAQLASTLATIPALEAAIAVRMHRIAVLTGRSPAALITRLDAPASLPRLTDAIDPGTPGDLLRRRPDVAAAEHRLEAATARIGVATADLFPRFTLGALIGTQAASTGALFERDSETRLLALGVDWSFLDVGRVRARIAAADAAAAEHLARYQQTVLRALEETETALSGYRHTQRQREHLREAAEAGARATALARLQFDGGLIEFLDVLDAERIQLEAEDRLARSEADAAVRLVAIYRALAGGWPERVPL